MKTTKHTADCSRVFSRLDLTCPRCQELAKGYKARGGWGASRKASEARRSAEIRAHVCSAATCGPVCTAFDW